MRYSLYKIDCMQTNELSYVSLFSYKVVKITSSFLHQCIFTATDINFPPYYIVAKSCVYVESVIIDTSHPKAIALLGPKGIRKSTALVVS